MFSIVTTMFYFVADFLMNQVMVMEKVRISIYHPVFHVLVFKRQYGFAFGLAIVVHGNC